MDIQDYRAMGFIGETQLNSTQINWPDAYTTFRDVRNAHFKAFNEHIRTAIHFVSLSERQPVLDKIDEFYVKGREFKTIAKTFWNSMVSLPTSLVEGAKFNVNNVPFDDTTPNSFPYDATYPSNDWKMVAQLDSNGEYTYTTFTEELYDEYISVLGEVLVLEKEIMALMGDTFTESSEESYSPIEGYVYDSYGNPVKDAKVTVFNGTKTDSIFAITDKNGKYIISSESVESFINQLGYDLKTSTIVWTDANGRSRYNYEFIVEVDDYKSNGTTLLYDYMDITQSNFYGAKNDRSEESIFKIILNKETRLDFNLLTPKIPTGKFTTTQTPGQLVNVNVKSTTGYVKCVNWYRNSYQIHGSGDPYSDFSFNFPVYKTDTTTDKTFKLISCDANGKPSGEITRLDISNAQLTSVDISDLTGLTFLNLNNNQLTTLDLTGLTGLTQLSLESNQLTSFDGTGLSSLTYLNLYGNQLTSFDGTGLSSLTGLYLYNNQLTSFDGGDMILLTDLHFQAWWNITTLESFDGGNMSGLTTLNLSGNQLTSFNGTGLSSLTYLELQENQLSTFDGTGLSSLTDLYLNGNQLTSFNENGLSSLIVLYLQNNPLTPQVNDSILSQLVLNGFVGTIFSTSNGRTSAGTADWNTLKNLGWDVQGADLLLDVPVTFVTSKFNDFVNIGVTTTTGYWKAQHAGVTTYNFESGNNGVHITNSNGDVRIVSCDVDGNISGDITHLNLDSSQIISFNGTGLSGMTQLNLDNNNITSLDVSELSSLNQLNLQNNPLTSEDNDSILSQLASNGLSDGVFTTSNGRTSAGTADYDTLIGLGWDIERADLILDVPVTFVTSKFNDSVNISVTTTTGYWKSQHDGTTTQVNTDGSGVIQITNSNGEVKVVSCDEDGNISGDITQLFLESKQITSFNGTGLSSLTYLDLQENQLTSFNGTGLTSLNTLILYNNQLSSFDGSGLSSLTVLYLDNNQLTSFDGTDLSSLTLLNLNNNPLVSFNGGDMGQITDLDFSSWNITTLESFDGGNMTGLIQLGIYNNQLTSFDGTGLSNLNYLTLDNNQLTSFNGTGLSGLIGIELGNNQLTSFDGTGLSSLTFLNLENNQLTSFDGTGLSSLTNLSLNSNPLVSFNGGDMGQITSIDFTTWGITTLESFNGGNMSGLTTLYLNANQLTTFDGTGLSSLTYLDLTGNQLTTLDLTGLSSLTDLHLANNPLTSFIGGDMGQITTLDFVSWNITTLESFDGGNMSGLTNLYLHNNQLTSFDGTGLSSLTSLGIEGNQITSFDGTGLSGLTELNLANNQLTSFDGSGLSSLTGLDLINNQLTSFSGTGLSGLTQLNLRDNQLTSFDGTGLSSLTDMWLDNNQLTSFDGTVLSSLISLVLHNNQLTSFDLTGLTGLTQLHLTGNPLPPEQNSSVMSQLVSYGLENGTFTTSGGRSFGGTYSYNTLIDRGWFIEGADVYMP